MKTYEELVSDNPHLATILRKMCKVVGADVHVVNSTNDWYRLHTWTKEQEGKFLVWMADYLYKKKDARKLWRGCMSRKKDCKEAAFWFVWNYGWRISE